MHHNHATAYSVSIQTSSDVPYLQSVVKVGNHRARKLATAQINYLQSAAKEDALAEAMRVVVERKRAARAHRAAVHAARSAAAKRAAQTVKARKLAAKTATTPETV